MKKIKTESEYEFSLAELENIIREKHFPNLSSSDIMTLVPSYESYYGGQVFKGLKITVKNNGD